MADILGHEVILLGPAEVILVEGRVHVQRVSGDLVRCVVADDGHLLLLAEVGWDVSIICLMAPNMRDLLQQFGTLLSGCFSQYSCVEGLALS